MDGLFGSPNFWKPHRYWICQTGGLDMWVGLHSVSAEILCSKTGRPTRKQEMDILRSWPYEVSSCRCKRCRYIRLYRKANEKAD